MERNNNKKNETNWPAALYVEGQDQFRGWFNSSLITSVILANKAPYQQVLSHGFVVDEKGHKMSKSLGNVIDPEEVIEKFGADILRLWVISSDFTKEIKVSIPILENLRESYQKIRNTLRFLLGNLNNLSPEIKSEKDLEKKLNVIDYYILSRLEKLVKESKKKYSEYSFNHVYSSLLNFCINDLSSFYFEIIKDSLYCDSIDSQRRKQVTAALYYLLGGLLKVIIPILPYLAEEVYQNISFQFGFAEKESAYLMSYEIYSSYPPEINKKLTLITDFFLPVRQDAYQALEKARREQIIDTNSQARLTIYLKEDSNWDHSELDLKELLLVAETEVKISKKKKTFIPPTSAPIRSYYWKGNFCSIVVKKTNRKRCIRCWNYRELEKDVCSRCEKILWS